MPRFTQFSTGIVNALDTGRGRKVELTWNEAIPTVSPTNVVYYLVYYSTKRLDVFSEGPKFIVTNESVIIPNLTNSDTYYFAIRAFEIAEADLKIDELRQIGPYLYEYKSTALIVEIEENDTIIPVNSVDGMPLSGFITIDSEVIAYSSVQITPFPAFILSSVFGRGSKNTDPADHDAGSTVRMYIGTLEDNSVIQRATPTIEYPYNQNVDGYGNPADGYGPREKNDFVTTDYSAANEKVNFLPYDYCGYHSTKPEEYFKGLLCGTYAGGEFNGQRGLDLYDRNMGRLEFLINQTGEQVILLQRIWSGEKCPCMDTRREHQRARCEICYGTGFVGGYTIYHNPRNPITGKVYVRFKPHEEDLIIMQEGLSQDTKPNAWALPFPVIKDRDFLVRFDETGVEMWRYEVLRATRNRLLYAAIGQQELVLARENKTDIIYQFPLGLT